MSDETRKTHETIEIGFGGLFKGIGNLLDLVSKLAEDEQAEHVQFGEAEALGGKAKGVYGISVRLGMGGKPVIEQFGNIKATERGAEVDEVREPLVDVLDEGERLLVIVEVPGVEADDIHHGLNGDILDIAARGRERQYHKEVLLPSPGDADTMQWSYHNGILKVEILKRVGPS